jgi:adenylate cyclase
VSIDWDGLETAGVFDPKHEKALERRELIEFLAGEGATTDAMIAAHQADALISLASDSYALSHGSFAVAELAERSGFPQGIVEDLYAVIGVPVLDLENKRFDQSDVRFLTNLVDGPASMFEISELAEMMRVFGTSLARIADASVSVFAQGIEQRMVAQGATEVELARMQVEAQVQAEKLPDIIRLVLRHHMVASIRRSRAAMTAADGLGARVCVGFVDVVGFTPMSESLDSEALAELVSTFENRSTDVVTRHGGQVLKHLGDEVMFLAVDPIVACTVALALVADFEAQGVKPHGGLTLGTTVTRRGDYYGPTVNLASRLVNHAVPGEVLVNHELVESLENESGLVFVPAGRRMIRGVSEPVRVWTLTIADGD